MSKKQKTPKVTKTPKKKGISRICGLLFLVACALVVYFVSFTMYVRDDVRAWVSEEKTLLEMARMLFTQGNAEKLFGFLPVFFAGTGKALIVNNLLPYGLAFCFGLAALLFLLALCTGSSGLVKTGLIFTFLGATAFFVCIYLISIARSHTKILDMNALSIMVISFLSFIVVCIITHRRKIKAEPATADPVTEYLNAFQKEKSVEAYAYEGGPVAGVEVAEEVYPTVAAIEAQKDADGNARNTVASLLGNGFDPFIITLNEKERTQFVDLYVLRCKGAMPEIPKYVVGGENKDFFHKIFIYLGQYRDKIPSELLEKIYNYSMKI